MYENEGGCGCECECDLLHEHLAPSTLFSFWAFSQVQCMADCLPHEQVASWAQMQPPWRPQQVAGTAATGAEDIL